MTVVQSEQNGGLTSSNDMCGLFRKNLQRDEESWMFTSAAAVEGA